MYCKGIKLSDKLVKKAAIYYTAQGRSYLYRRVEPLSDGRIRVAIYQTYPWTGCKSHICDVLYTPDK